MHENTPVRSRRPVERPVTPENPLISLQTSTRFADSDEGYAGLSQDRRAEAERHGREAVRVWTHTVPDDIKPYCELQFEIRTHDHRDRYECFRRGFSMLQEAGIPANLQVSDPHEEYVFDPDYVEMLLDEFPCIQTLTTTESRFEYFHAFNVDRYALSPIARHTIDMIHMAARRGKRMMISLQDNKLLFLAACKLNAPLLETIRSHSEYVTVLNEHIGPRLLTRHSSNCGFWLSGAAANWGVEPQSWWFENARMIEPGVFGQTEQDNTRIMPPDLYRAMILLGASLGATAYNFEPFWDLFDYDNSHCWTDVIYPTLMEVIRRRLIPSREQVVEKMRVAYQYKEVKNITEFHEILRDVDWIGDEGNLMRAAYGLWNRYLEHELIPNKSRYYFIPLLPQDTPSPVLAEFDEVLQVNQCASEQAYQAILDKHYPEPDARGTAWITSVNGHTYVMQTHENLYERQDYSVELPKPVTGLRVARDTLGVHLDWDADPGATRYYVYRHEGDAVPPPNGYSRTIWHKHETVFTDPELRVTEYHGDGASKPMVFREPDPRPPLARTLAPGYVDSMADPSKTFTYTVTAETATRARKEGTVNYLDFLVFSETESLPGEQATVRPDGNVDIRPVTDPEDHRPASQVWHPIYTGAEGGHRAVAEQIVDRIEAFKDAYEAADWRRLTELYSARYQDPNGYHREYAGRAWKWWFFRNNYFTLLRQIRCWDFNDFDTEGTVRARLFCLGRACRHDDQPFGYWYDGTVRVPRHADEEVTFTWVREEDDCWRIIRTEPAFPNFNEMLWNSRGHENRGKLTPGADD